jgi:Flp pilus assembly protein TadG
MSRMLARFRSGLGRIRRDERGVAFVEFGFLVPILALFVLGIIDIAMGVSHRFTMQQAVNRSLELLLVRPPTAADNQADVSYTDIRQEAATAAGVPIAQVTADRFVLCNGVAPTPATATTCPVGQQLATYLRVTVTKPYTGAFYLGIVPLSVSGSMRLQ